MHFNHILIDPFFSSFILFVFAFIHPEKKLDLHITSLASSLS
ncbi:hypothetical protein HDEF_0099 [Candidatus Hamiltonella defensa 5AT (Acyrthosiphon pisum)]|uniref:Uncharacterized protein n=1 Tax=Hamiltonella defensa subsp. Acyrthosiphon pisum (strain 5AT) TaxID=572265 RepID=C4K8N6_HAMD5|nr:hypothetical protein HDEF_0099 [Candidatus Hamiltonella defensa 5AT (Acyrthosiphon pisum)]